MRYLILIATMWVGSVSWATIYDPHVTLKDIGALKVAIHDDTSGGCWTNMKEAKDYAEAKLDIAGADLSYVSDDVTYAGKRTKFFISVFGYRMSDGVCVGHAEIQIGGFLVTDIWTQSRAAAGHLNVVGHLDFSKYTRLLRNPNNVNNEVLDTVKSAIEEWEDRN